MIGGIARNAALLATISPFQPACRGRSGGARENAGRIPGVSIKVISDFRKTCREKYSEAAAQKIFDLMNASQNEWLILACAKELLDRAWGKPREQATVDQDLTGPAVYETLEDVRQRLIERGLPVDHMGAPRLVKYEPEDSES